jgi:protein-L-isoaspartate(D-aspartate) O-methyltransferase
MSWEHLLDEDDYRLYRDNISLLEDQILNHFPEAYKTPEILSAIRRVPRHVFVNAGYRYLAYTDNAFPTVSGLTTSAPSVIAEMISHLRIGRGDKVLEIGTGTGYEAAVLSEMGVKVFSIEIDTHLANTANRILVRLGYKLNRRRESNAKEEIRRFSGMKALFPHRGTLKLFVGNGRYGLREHSPFRGIVLAASIPHRNHIAHLTTQLSTDGGRLDVPSGRRDEQILHIVEMKRGNIALYVVEGTTFNFVRLI